MADFTITFEDNTQFVFTDSTDYTGLGAVAKTDLVVKYPPITGVTAITLDVYDENVASLGDPFTFVIANEASLGALTDGVYEFVFNVLDAGQVVLDTVTKYYINDFAVLNCLRTLIDEYIDEQCDDKWCEIAKIGALLDTAKRDAAAGNFARAQEIMDNLVGVCDNC